LFSLGFIVEEENRNKGGDGKIIIIINQQKIQNKRTANKQRKKD